jgi:pimeloyl-ACP methyl ester carboxylesterase
VHRLHLLPEFNQSLEVLEIAPADSIRFDGSASSLGLKRADSILGTTLASGVAELSRPTLVFLHEGLGSITQWRDFPQALCDQLGLPGLVYARQGYGLSSLRARPADSHFMHLEAQQVLPALLASLKIERPILIGHSDGGSIALLYGAWAEKFAEDRTRDTKQHAFNPVPTTKAITAPAKPLALCVMAPHLFVEDDGVSSIAIARKLFDADPSFRERLGKHHRDVAHTFNNWADVWLSQEFKTWNIEAEVSQIRCPIFAIQGCDDQYGSLAQIRRIAGRIGTGVEVELLEIQDCKHSPHLERQTTVLNACRRFLAPHVK